MAYDTAVLRTLNCTGNCILYVLKLKRFVSQFLHTLAFLFLNHSATKKIWQKRAEVGRKGMLSEVSVLLEADAVAPEPDEVGSTAFLLGFYGGSLSL